MTAHQSDQHYDVTVIGAGIVGICCAISLLKRGKSVRIIDATGVAEKTSFGNAGVISPWSIIPQALPGMHFNTIKWLIDPTGPVRIRPGYLPRFLPWALRFFSNTRLCRVKENSAAIADLMRGNIGLYRQYLSGTGQESLIRDSHLVIAYEKVEQIDLNDTSIRLRVDEGAEVEIVDSSTLREIEPALSPRYQAAILLKDQGRTVAPARLAKTLAKEAQRNGAVLRVTKVKKLIPKVTGGWQIETREEKLEASIILVAAGPWSPKLLEPLGLKMPLACERGYHLEFADPGVMLNNSVLDVKHKFITSSMEGGIRSAGTAEFDALDAAPNYRRAEMLKPLTKSMLPDLNTDSTSQWMGIRPSFPDSLPCIDSMPRHRDLYLAFGHGHYGLGMAPRTGELIADKICSNDVKTETSPYAAGRFKFSKF